MRVKSSAARKSVVERVRVTVLLLCLTFAGTVSAQELFVVPTLDCVQQNEDGTLTAYFGYINKEAETLNIPFGSNNIFLPAPYFRGQPTAYEPGVFRRVFGVTFPASSYVEWTLGNTALRVDSNTEARCYDCNCPPGPAGPEGPQGPEGPAGPKGDTGTTGPQGLRGETGPRGEQGVQGVAGPKGDRGEIGPRGEAGPAGPKGDTGTTGPQGLRGETGPRGEQGIPGIAGPKGDRGEIGPRGEAGPAGPRGETGPAGPRGDTGTTGPQGLRGEAGPRGEQGIQGVAGPKGDRGEIGPRGEPGPTGPRGEAGPVGPRGETGPQGPIGPQGPAGPSGADNAWSITGSANTNPGTEPGRNYIGTADSTPLVIATSATAAMIIDERGKIGIGTAPSEAALTVNGYIVTGPQGIVFPDGSVQRTAYKKSPRKKLIPYPWEGAPAEDNAVAEYDWRTMSNYASEQEKRIQRLEAELETLKKLINEQN